MASIDAIQILRPAAADDTIQEAIQEWEAVVRISPERLHGDPKVAWWRLRRLLPAGERTLVRSYRELCQDLEISESSVRRCLRSLHAAELIRINRPRGPDGKPLKGGWLSIVLADPLEAAGVARPAEPALTVDDDRQGRLFSEPPMEGGRAPRLAEPDSTEVSPHPSTDPAQESPSDVSSRPEARVPPDPSTDPVEAKAPEVSPHPAPDAARSPDSPRKLGSLSEAFARLTAGGGCSIGNPSKENTKERTPRNLPKYQGTKEGSLPGRSLGVSLVRAESAGSGGTVLTVGSGMEAAPIGQAIAAAAAAFSRPAWREARKRDLEQEILAAAGDLANRSLAGRFADLVVYCGMPHEDLDRVLIDLRELRRVGSLRSGGMFFNFKSHQVGRRFCRACRQRQGKSCPLGINYLKRKEK